MTRGTALARAVLRADHAASAVGHGNVRTQVTSAPDGDGETWCRDSGGARMASRYRVWNGRLVEKLGLVEFSLLSSASTRRRAAVGDHRRAPVLRFIQRRSRPGSRARTAASARKAYGVPRQPRRPLSVASFAMKGWLEQA